MVGTKTFNPFEDKDKLIKDRKGYEEAKLQLDKRLLENPEYQYMVEYDLQELLSRRDNSKIYMGANFIKVASEPVVEYCGDKVRVKQSTMTVRLFGDGRMEVIKATGELFNREGYYKDVKDSSSPYVMDVNCERHIFSQDGIELANSSYFKGGMSIPYDTSMTMCETLDNSLSQEGVYVPGSWTDNGPNPPRVSEGAFITGSQRLTGLFSFDGLSGIQRIYQYQVGPYGMNTEGEITQYPINYEEWLAQVSHEWPERLAKDITSIIPFAELRDGKVQPVTMYTDYSLDHLCRFFSHNAFERLDKSRTKVNSPKQYEALHRLLSRENAHYVDPFSQATETSKTSHR